MACNRLYSIVASSSQILLFDKQLAGKIWTGSRKLSVTAGRNMRFVQFKAKCGGPQHLGAQINQDGDIFDISAVDSSIPNSLVKFLATGNGILEKAKRSVTQKRQVNKRLFLRRRAFAHVRHCSVYARTLCKHHIANNVFNLSDIMVTCRHAMLRDEICLNFSRNLILKN